MIAGKFVAKYDSPRRLLTGKCQYKSLTRMVGGINNNSYVSFFIQQCLLSLITPQVREKGKTDGASNGTYYTAYVYFEKVRIFEDKKKVRRANATKSHVHQDYLGRMNTMGGILWADNETRGRN
ncbi:hypothetical protein CVT25_002231 [Psilocybe cyanescens]|uniref:Uncharacterized protein n=1 Tax=Psilocybe cyanescens TaxID=93625 RepID=A0A409XF73_PSICY|nr:hypothetical protein CVT25_002231 [Psilocybe cyanescens]